jgi:hypothetical protein
MAAPTEDNVYKDPSLYDMLPNTGYGHAQVGRRGIPDNEHAMDHVSSIWTGRIFQHGSESRDLSDLFEAFCETKSQELRRFQ